MKLYHKLRQLDFSDFYPHLFAISVGMVACGALFGAYRIYRGFQDRAAQKLVGLYLEDLRKAAYEPAADWQKIATEFGFAAQELGNNNLTPYCLAAQAEALFEKGDFLESMRLLAKATEQLPERSPLFYLFKTKQALMMMDSTDALVRQQGLAILTQLARTSENINKDSALYYLGYHYWIDNNLDEAKKIWQELVDEDRHEKSSPSPWAALAAAKLPYIL